MILHFGYSHTLSYIAREQLLALRDEGWDIQLACPEDSWTPRLRDDGFVVHPVRLPHRAGALDAARGAKDFVQVARRLRPALVHTHNAHHGVVGRTVARALGIPALHTWRYNPMDAASGRASTRFYAAIEALASRAGQKVLFQNGEDMRYAIERRIVRPSDAVLVHNGVDVERYRQAGRPAGDVRDDLGVPRDAELLVCLARLDERKGLPDVVAALGALSASRPRLHLVVLGTGPLRDELIRQASELDVADRLHLAGQRDDVPDVLAAGDLLVLASRREGVPRAVMEAMAARLAVVATDVVGTREVVKHEETGLLVPHGDRDALAAAIARLLDDRALADRLISQAYELVSTEWSQRLVVQRVDRIYRELVDPHSAPPVKATAVALPVD